MMVYIFYDSIYFYDDICFVLGQEMDVLERNTLHIHIENEN